MQHGYDTGRQGIDKTREPPRAALARFYADSVVHENTALEFVARTFGEHRILFGSDWPFPMGVMEPHRQIGSLPNALRKKVFWDNPYSLRQQYAWRAEVPSSM
jgi:aminocarboxymuconate-semialdehyde decarboxylase